MGGEEGGGERRGEAGGGKRTRGKEEGEERSSWFLCSKLCEGSLAPLRISSCLLSPPGECYLTEWTTWSRCQISCVNGDDLGFGSVQVRSRAVVAQDPENLLQCPEQELEARPCTGQSRSEVRGDCGSSCAMLSQQRGTVWSTSGRPDPGEVPHARCGVSAPMDSTLQVGSPVEPKFLEI